MTQSYTDKKLQRTTSTSELIDIFMVSSPSVLNNLSYCIVVGNYLSAMKIAQGLRASAATLGANKISKIAYEVEEHIRNGYKINKFDKAFLKMRLADMATALVPTFEELKQVS